MVRGRIKNARSGRQLSGVTVRVDGSNNRVNSRWGFFTLRNIQKGYVDLVYERPGYITAKKRINIVTNVNSGGIADVSMSPVMRNDQWRAVLKWGRSPSDLDTYAKWWPWNKVCWYRRVQGAGWGWWPKGILEQDKTGGYGPETLFLKNMGRCRGWGCDINYLVNDYGRTGSMLRRGEAEVTLYTGNRVAGSWKISDCPRSVFGGGNWWHVFTVSARTNRLKWTCLQRRLIQTSSNHTDFDINSLMDAASQRREKPRLLLHNHRK